MFALEHRALLADPTDKAPFGDYMRTLPPGMPAATADAKSDSASSSQNHNFLYTDKMAIAVVRSARASFLTTISSAWQMRCLRMWGGNHHGKWVLKKAIERHLRQMVIAPKPASARRCASGCEREKRELVDDTLSVAIQSIVVVSSTLRLSPR